jgi:hypothetical protein
VLLRSWAALGDFKRCLDNVVLVALYHLRFMLVLCVYACFIRFSASPCRPLYKASLENIEGSFEYLVVHSTLESSDLEFC